MVQTKKMRSIIIGAGKYGEVFLSYLQEAGIDIVGFLDDDPIYEGQRIHQIPVLGKTSLLDTLRFKDDIEALKEIFVDEDTVDAVVKVMEKSPSEIQIVLKVVIGLYNKIKEN